MTALFKHGSLPAPKHTGRFTCVNHEFELIGGELPDGTQARHPVIVSVGYERSGLPREVIFEGRGKIGQGIDLLLHDLSTKVSRILQDRDPITGEHL